MNLHVAAAVAGLSLVTLSGSARAAIIFNVDEVGSDVVINASGTVDLTGLTKAGTGGFTSGLTPSKPIIGAGQNGTALYYNATFSSSEDFGSGGAKLANINSGMSVGFEFDPTYIAVPVGYVSQNVITGMSTISNASFASLGLVEGKYDYKLANGDYFEVRVGPVPLPASAPLFGAGLIALGAAGYVAKRKKAAAAA